jgi:hypothetical protein
MISDKPSELVRVMTVLDGFSAANALAARVEQIAMKATKFTMRFIPLILFLENSLPTIHFET